MKEQIKELVKKYVKLDTLKESNYDADFTIDFDTRLFEELGIEMEKFEDCFYVGKNSFNFYMDNKESYFLIATTFVISNPNPNYKIDLCDAVWYECKFDEDLIQAILYYIKPSIDKIIKEKYIIESSKVLGFMIQHLDNDKEYYELKLSKEDNDAIFKILEKYGDDNESIRGNLKVKA